MTHKHNRSYKVPIANVIKTVPISTKPKDMITSVNESDHILFLPYSLKPAFQELLQ